MRQTLRLMKTKKSAHRNRPRGTYKTQRGPAGSASAALILAWVSSNVEQRNDQQGRSNFACCVRPDLAAAIRRRESVVASSARLLVGRPDRAYWQHSGPGHVSKAGYRYYGGSRITGRVEGCCRRTCTPRLSLCSVSAGRDALVLQTALLLPDSSSTSRSLSKRTLDRTHCVSRSPSPRRRGRGRVSEAQAGTCCGLRG